MLNITFEPTHTIRTDVNRQVAYNREPEHEARVVAHCKRVAKEFRKYRMLVRIMNILFKRATQKLKVIPKISTKRELREELRHTRIRTIRGIKEAWL